VIKIVSPSLLHTGNQRTPAGAAGALGVDRDAAPAFVPPKHNRGHGTRRVDTATAVIRAIGWVNVPPTQATTRSAMLIVKPNRTLETTEWDVCRSSFGSSCFIAV